MSRASNNPVAGSTLPVEDNGTADQATLISYAYAKRHGVLAEHLEDGSCQVGCRPDVSSQVLAELRRHLGKPYRLHILAPAFFERQLQEFYHRDSSDGMRIMDDMGDDMDMYRVAQQLTEPEDLLESEDDAPIIRLINAMLTQAVKENASDIHIEPYEDRMVMRFRVDGVLREVLEPNRILAPLIVSRIKVMAKLDIAEKRLPQDGRIALKIAGHPVDLRVSTLPTGNGERIVLRLLDKQAGRLDLEHLGMAADTLEVMKQIIARPNGILLVTGPTGSGKTTTLYAVLSLLNDKQRNIMTVEDPIEYDLDGISQTAVNSKVDMSFARGLRAILRQDPDVVMVGEIRDLETARIAVQASLTGHLVLSTLHTNTAVGAVTRLHDMGIEPFLMSSSLIGVLAQRLVRVLCPDCKQPYQPSESECARFALDADTPPQLFHAAGCETCQHSGYHGRTGIYELIEVDSQLRSMIHDKASEHAIEAHVRQHARGLHQDGLRLVKAGITTLDEVLRVTREA